MSAGLARRLTAEALGTGVLLMAVVGSGIMAERLSDGNGALMLLANTLATVAALIVLITLFAPVSGAHFNPCVTLYRTLDRSLRVREAALYIGVQIGAGIVGVWIAHAMFAMPLFELSHKLRGGPAQWVSEFVATFGLIGVIACAARHRPAATPLLVGLYIAAAYWFTASTCFANPAVTLARSLSDSFAGIAPGSIAGFLVAQIAATLAGFGFWRWFLRG